MFALEAGTLLGVSLRPAPVLDERGAATGQGRLAGGGLLLQPAKPRIKEHYLPKLMIRQPYESWESEGSKSAMENARQKAKEMLAKHEPRLLDPGIEKELEAYRSMVAERPMEDLYKYEAPEMQDFQAL